MIWQLRTQQTFLPRLGATALSMSVSNGETYIVGTENNLFVSWMLQRCAPTGAFVAWAAPLAGLGIRRKPRAAPGAFVQEEQAFRRVAWHDLAHGVSCSTHH